jgi:two-component system response regulator MtrA
VSERALVVEDDASLREILDLVLTSIGMEVVTAADGADAVERFGEGAFDLVVLDLMLPKVDGYEVCREIRRSSTVPIVMLTARTDTADLVKGLELGADDYVTKPFEAPELIARVRAVLRRARRQGTEVIRVGDLVIDADAFTVERGGRPVSLTATEFRLLLELARHAGQVLTRESLLSRVWNYDYLGDSRLVDMAVKRLRDKVEEQPSNPTLVVTVRGVGYRLVRP